jgi:hypothetical protein
VSAPVAPDGDPAAQSRWSGAGNGRLVTVAAAVAGLVVGAVTMGLLDRDDPTPMQLQSGRGFGGSQTDGGMPGPGGGHGERNLPGVGDGNEDAWEQDEWDHHRQAPGDGDDDTDGTDDPGSEGSDDEDPGDGSDQDDQSDDGRAFGGGPGGFVAPGGGDSQGTSGAS